jgi:hypothetical protein
MTDQPITVPSGPYFHGTRRRLEIGQELLGGTVDPALGEWNLINHSVIAAEVFALCLKLELVKAGLRELTDRDELKMDALDGRIEALTPAPGDPRSAWALPLAEASRRRPNRKIADAISSGEFGEDTDEPS